jgi:hypothetical protein
MTGGNINGLKPVFTVHRPTEASTKSATTGGGTRWRGLNRQPFR